MLSISFPWNQSHVGSLDEHEYEEVLESMKRGFMRDQDKVKKLKALVGQNTVTCQQVIGIMEVTKTVWCGVAIAMYPSISDKDNFEKVLAALQWEVCTLVHLLILFWV